MWIKIGALFINELKKKKKTERILTDSVSATSLNLAHASDVIQYKNLKFENVNSR